MQSTGILFFDTALGLIGIAWSGAGVTQVQLPEASEAETRSRLRRRVPEGVEASPPAGVQGAADRMTALLRGEAADLSIVELDWEGIIPFHRRVYEAARRIGPGMLRTYGDIAIELGDKGAARAVGQALGRNPFPIIVPCHRVVAADGRTGGFSARGGIRTKLRILEIERPLERDPGTLFAPPVPDPASAGASSASPPGR